MKKSHLLLISLLSVLSARSQTKKSAAYIPADKTLFEQIVAMDKLFFDAYNTCDLKTQDSIYSEKIEFFHDKAGLITSKEEILKGTKANICGKVTRYLFPESVEVYLINDYGAVEIGRHRFYNNQEPDAKSIPSKFIIVWKNETGKWKITKVISLH